MRRWQRSARFSWSECQRSTKVVNGSAQHLCAGIAANKRQSGPTRRPQVSAQHAPAIPRVHNVNHMRAWRSAKVAELPH